MEESDKDKNGKNKTVGRQIARKHRDTEQELENVTGNRKRNSIREPLRCD